MLKTILSPLTTSTSTGVVVRYLITIVSSVVAILSILGVLTPAQVADITRKVAEISAQLPGLLAAVSSLIALGIPVYAAITKSMSNRAADAAKKIDKQIPSDTPAVIKTPVNQPDILIPPTK